MTEEIKKLIDDRLRHYTMTVDMPCSFEKSCKEVTDLKNEMVRSSKWSIRLSMTTLFFVTGLLVTFFIYLSDLKVTNATLSSIQRNIGEQNEAVKSNHEIILENTRIIERLQGRAER